MLRIAALILFSFVLGSVSWGVGGCGGGSGPDPSTDIGATDFEGAYSLRDDSCSSGAFNSFRITETAEDQFSLTVLDSGPYEGDIYEGDLDVTTLNFSFPDGDCAMGRVISEASAASVEEMTTVTTRYGDLTVFCEDPGSSDGSCFLSYQPD
jgi:hypothetical protein